jgi:hypothetical protein
MLVATAIAGVLFILLGRVLAKLAVALGMSYGGDIKTQGDKCAVMSFAVTVVGWIGFTIGTVGYAAWHL